MLEQPGILLIDDDMGVREGISDLLACVAPVRSVDSWGGALECIRSERVGLVVTDYRMHEDAGGEEFVEAVHALGLPVILCTGAHPTEVQQALSAFRPDQLIAKPFEVDVMLEAAQRLYRR